MSNPTYGSYIACYSGSILMKFGLSIKNILRIKYAEFDYTIFKNHINKLLFALLTIRYSSPSQLSSIYLQRVAILSMHAKLN